LFRKLGDSQITIVESPTSVSPSECVSENEIFVHHLTETQVKKQFSGGTPNPHALPTKFYQVSWVIRLTWWLCSKNSINARYLYFV
jgi:hypothetical protein